MARNSRGKSGGRVSSGSSSAGRGSGSQTPPIEVTESGQSSASTSQSSGSSSQSSHSRHKFEVAKIPIPKLDPTDFPSWDFKMKAYLMSHGSWGAIDFVSDNWSQLNAADQSIMKASAFVTISHSLGDIHEYIARDFNPDQPKELWERLHAMFNKNSIHKQLSLAKKWTNLQWRPDHTVDSFLGDIALLRAQHKTAECPISDDAAFVKLISSLPKVFDTEVSLMEDWEKPDLNRARELLLKQQNAVRKQKFEESNEPIMEASSYVMHSDAKVGRNDSKSSNSNSNSKKKRKFSCYYCGKAGHVRPNCKQKIADEKNGIFRKNTKGPTGSVHVASSAPSGSSQSSSGSSSSSFSLENVQSKSYNFSLPGHASPFNETSKAEGKQEQMEDEDFGFIFMLPVGLKPDEWIIDSGATHHMCNIPGLISNPTECNAHIVTGKSNADLVIKEKGLVQFHPVNPTYKPLCLSNVLFSNDVSMNIISIPQLINFGCTAVFEENRAVVKFQKDIICLGIKDEQSMLYILCSHHAVKQSNGTVAALKPCDEQLRVLHNRLGHLNRADILRMSKEHLVSGLPTIEGYPANFECPHCWAGKTTRQPYPKKEPNSIETASVCDELHSDFFGPMTPISRYKHAYFIIFVDKGSRFAFLVCLSSLELVAESYKRVRNIIFTQLKLKIKKFVCDGHSTYMSTKMSLIFEEDGTFMKVRAPYCPEQNGLAERRGRTTIEMGRTLMIQSGVPPSCWEDAISHANYVRNRVPTRSLPGTTPFEKFWGHKPDLQWLRPFGCLAFVLIHKELRNSKFEATAQPGVLLGISDRHSAYKIMLLSDRSIKIAKDVRFYEDVFPFRRNPSINLQELNPMKYSPAQDEILSHGDDPLRNFDHRMHQDIGVEPIARAQSYQVCESAGAGCLMVDESSFTNLIEGYALNALDCDRSNDIVTPKTLSKALQGPQSDLWMASLKAEYEAMVKYNTFAPLSEAAKTALQNGSIKVHGTRVVLTIKRNDRGEIARYKSRLVVQGFTMEHGIDYDSTFSPVARINSIRIIAAMARAHNLDMLHTDVPNAYLNGKATKLVLVRLPEYWNSVIGPDLGPDGSPVIMVGSVYGTPDAGKNWNTCIHQFFISRGFTQCSKEPCMYTKGKLPNGILVGVWVDDNYIVSGNPHDRDQLLKEMEDAFNVKNLGIISFSLGVHFEWKERGLHMTQTAYIEKIVSKFKLEGCKPLYVPMQKGTKLLSSSSPTTEVEKSKMLNIPYKNAIGSLLYLAICTRPDITYAVCSLARFSQNPGQEHWTLVRNIIRYVANTKDLGLFFAKIDGPVENLRSTGFCDAAYNDTEQGKSTTGYVVKLFNIYPISWRSKLTTSTALSSMEAELIALHSLSREIAWTRMVLSEISSLTLVPTTIMCDNNPVVQLTHGPRVTEKNKHIRPKYFYVLDLVRDKEVSVLKIGTDDQIADIFTKPLANPQFSKLRSSLCVHKQGEE